MAPSSESELLSRLLNAQADLEDLLLSTIHGLLRFLIQERLSLRVVSLLLVLIRLNSIVR